MPILALVAFWLLAQGTPPEKATISGIVVDSVTGETLSKVSLRLGPRDQVGPASITTTDEEGRFALVGLDAGLYQLRGRRSGYLIGTYGARRPDAIGTFISLEAGQQLTDLTFELTPGGAIAGTIRDSDGEAIEDAVVTRGEIRYSRRGRPRVVLGMLPATSDDRGEYRFHGLVPGNYYISAMAYQSSWSSFTVDRSPGTGSAE